MKKYLLYSLIVTVFLTACEKDEKEVKEEIKAYGKTNGYTYILGGGDGGSVLFGDETKDLTEEILTILNNKYKS